MILFLKKIYNWLFLNILPLFFNFIAFFIPKCKKVWVFGCWFGDNFSDNSKYLYLYCKQGHPEIDCVWLTKNKDIILPLRSNGVNAVYTYSLQGFIYNLIASVGVYGTSSVTDLNLFCCSKRMKAVLLWHGQPLKRLPEDLEYDNGGIFIKFLIRLMKFNKIVFLQSSNDLVIASSENEAKIFERCFCKNVSITGYPRNDAFMINTKIDYLEGLKKKYDYMVMYCPTFRGHPSEKGCETVDLLLQNLEEINSLLKSYNSVFIVKLHYVDQKKIISVKNKFSNILFLNDKDIENDINLALKSIDLLITDYSGIYFDYLLLDKPIIFFPFDYNYYKNSDRGFYYDYNKVTPGPKAYEWSSVLMHVKDFFSGIDDYKDERKLICSQFNKYNDASNSERVFKEILKLVER